jgi:hypothetical protein
MSNQIVIYLSDQELKTWLKTKSQNEGVSLSKLISTLLAESKVRLSQIEDNPFLNIPDLSNKDIKEWNNAIEKVKKSNKIKPDDYYKNLFD